MKMRFEKVSEGLVPFDEESKEALSKIPNGAFLELNVRRPRNQAHHRKFFKMLDLAREMVDVIPKPSTERLLLIIKDELGYYDVAVWGDKAIKEYRSISFATMTQEEFALFYDSAVDVILQMLPVDKPEFMKMLEEYF